MKKILLALITIVWGCLAQAQETYLFASRDTCDLYLDIYRPAEGADTTFQGIRKPAIIHVFGGGFVTGSRRDGYLVNWYKLLNQEGYTVVAIDYRLGMKGYKMKKGLSGLLNASDRFLLSQEVGVEDVFSAVRFLARNDVGVDVDNLVLAGNSAGAIITLASAQALANGQVPDLPEGFNFKGAISFAGAIISTSGAPKFQSAPCPVLLFHGTVDKAVAYNKLAAFGRGLWGSNYLAKKFKKNGYPYCFYRMKDRTHDVAGYHIALWPYEKAFLEQNVMLGHARTVDALVEDDSLPRWDNIKINDIY